MTRNLLDLTFSVLLCALSVYLWFAAGHFPVFGAPSPIGASFWPRLIAAAIFMVSLSLVIQTVAAGVRPSGSSGRSREWRINVKGMLLAVALVLGYFYGLEYAGFLVSTLVFLGIAINLLPYDNRIVKFIFPFIFTFLMILFFSYALSLPLPRGVGIFYGINSMFY